jgi:integrase
VASVDKRPNGQYRARWREFPGGPQKTRQFARKVDAERFLVEIQHRILSGSYTPPEAGRITVEAYSVEWRRRRTWAPATEDRIEREFRLHIIPKLGARPLASLRRAHIEEWVKALPLAPSSACMVYETLSNMLSAAVDDERIARNPAKGAKLPEAHEVPFVPLEVDEVREIAHAAPDHIRAAVVVDAGTGLRQGELFGLTIDRVDFMRREMRIDRQLWTPKAGPAFLKALKSKNSYRTIALSSIVLDALSAHIATYGPGRDGLVFHYEGRPIVRAQAATHMRRTTKRADAAAEKRAAGARAAGVKSDDLSVRTPLVGHTWHDLRHHHASVLLSEGVSPALVAERLGHDLKTLLTTYAHVIRKDEDRVRAIVDATLGGSAEGWLTATA